MTDTSNPTGTSKSASATAEEARNKASKVTRDTLDSAKKTASDAASMARDEAMTRADAAKGSVADEVSGVASALRTAAQEMRSGSPQERTFGQIAEGLADAAESLREKDLGEVSRDLSNFARSNPLVFLGGAALVGFAATRFAKASSEQSPQRRGDTYAPRINHDAGHGHDAPTQPRSFGASLEGADS